MSCTDGDELEQSYFAVLERASRYEVADSVLTLGTTDGPLARFHTR